MIVSSFVTKLRENDKARLSIAGFVGLVHLYGVIQMFFNEYFLEVFERFRMFTNISNILIFVILVLYLAGFKDKNWFKYLAVAGLVAILMTGLIYHFIVKGDDVMDFNGHVVHTFNPILYPIFYFLLVTPGIKLKHFWVSLVLPVIYFTVILIQGPFTGWYPYGFMDPSLPGKSLLDVLVFCLVILLPVIAVFTLGLIYLKNLLEKAVNKE
ncbi:Pr6Pr family membrane protein [Acholeplasma equirhinis]|uniref:Pr6Pr family membrane protein n=1 Tax=Acholeplasma equirhinis TaxID=555393 RepID=UPI00197AEC18|nr:Pr6Pr family membrane protein [Acholeplasma equirhinis]MBN3490525.1 Pr6Pr family membrane protein [Acholeplasma equirhinis]